jgi:hypothetical protein
MRPERAADREEPHEHGQIDVDHGTSTIDSRPEPISASSPSQSQPRATRVRRASADGQLNNRRGGSGLGERGQAHWAKKMPPLSAQVDHEDLRRLEGQLFFPDVVEALARGRCRSFSPRPGVLAGRHLEALVGASRCRPWTGPRAEPRSCAVAGRRDRSRTVMGERSRGQTIGARMFGASLASSSACASRHSVTELAVIAEGQLDQGAMVGRQVGYSGAGRENSR